MMKNGNKIFSIFLMLVGGIVCLLFIGGKIKDAIYIIGTQETTGYVTNVERLTQHHNNSSRNRMVTTTYVMTVAYDVNGEEYSVVFNSGSSVVSEGKTVKVYYKESNPQKAITDVGMKRDIDMMFPLMFGLGLFFFIVDKLKENE